MTKRFFLFACAVLIAAAAASTPYLSVYAQSSALPDQVILPQADPEEGRPFITNFTTSDYDAESQNWAVVEDDRGVIYIGNNSGVLEYDGVEWRLMQLPNRSTVRSLDKDSDGRIWVGGAGDIGYLAPDSLGRATFVSVLDEVPEEYREFADVWSTNATDDGIYFNVSSAILRWDGSSMKVFKAAATPFHVADVIDGIFYVRQWETGLLRMEQTPSGDSLMLVPGGDRFGNSRIYVMLPFGDGRILIGTREDGLLVWNPSAVSEEAGNFVPFRTEADDILAAGGIYLPGAVLPDGNFVIGTLSEGLVVIDHDGRLVRHIGRKDGLQDNTIYDPFVDSSGSLWLGLGHGIARVEIASPLTHYDVTAGIDGVTYTMNRHNGMLYAGSNTGVSVLDTDLRAFRKIGSFVAQVFSLLSVGDEHLVAAGNEGVYRLVGEQFQPIRLSVSRDFSAAWLHSWSRKPGVVIVGLYDGLAVLSRRSSGWVDEGRIPGIAEVLSIVETPDGVIWAAGRSQAYRVKLPVPDMDGSLDVSKSEVTLYGASDGLVEGLLQANRVGDEVYITGINETVFRFDQGGNRFVPDPIFDSAKSGHPLGWYVITEDDGGRIWISSSYGAPVIGHPREGESYAFETLHHLRKDRVLYTYPEEGGITWFMGSAAIIRYDTNQASNAKQTIPPIIRRVVVGEDERFGGTGQATALEVAHGTDAVQFAYAAPGAAAAPRYRTQLAGFDTDWSRWTSETSREYTNLPPGDYRFMVEAEGRGETTLALTVLPPWYRTWWAYLGFALLFGAATFAVDRLQRFRLGKKEHERSILREAELRAEAENKRRADAERLSEIGQAITSTLSTREVIDTVYEHVNALMDAAVFGIGIYNPKHERIDFPATKENGLTLPPYANDLDDESRPAVWCFTNREEFIVGDYAREYQRYVPLRQAPLEGEEVASIIYLPLVHQGKPVGVVTTQSFTKHAYSEYHVSVLRTLATYAAIAIDNAAAYRKLGRTLDDLKATQQQLIQQEKLASLGQLTAGIAHEIKNPLNFINNFASLSGELAEDLEKETDPVAFKAILADIKLTAAKIEEHGQRADGIVRSMMQHAREGSSEKETVDLNALVAEHIALAYHGKRAQSSNFSAEIEQDLGQNVGQAKVVAQDLGRVLLNLIGNAFDAVVERAAHVNGQYVPTVKVTTRRIADQIEIRVTDNGPGIPADVEAKIFEPFFTTKPTGQGTGLGLSMSHEIVTQGHGGTLTVESTQGEGTAFVIWIPGASD